MLVEDGKQCTDQYIAATSRSLTTHFCTTVQLQTQAAAATMVSKKLFQTHLKSC